MENVQLSQTVNESTTTTNESLLSDDSLSIDKSSALVKKSRDLSKSAWHRNVINTGYYFYSFIEKSFNQKFN